jgi:hypothetical protein
MKLRHFLTGIAVIVALVVSMTVAVTPVAHEILPGPSGVNPRPLFEWFNSSFQGCCFGAGVNRSVVATLPTVPNGTAVISVFGSFGVTSWMKLNHSLIVESGNCAEPFSPRGACDLYVGIWTPAAWRSYANGGPLDPMWCYPGNGSACQNISGGYVSTPNLSVLDGVSWEIVVWNVDTYLLNGQYQFDVYTSLPR